MSLKFDLQLNPGLLSETVSVGLWAVTSVASCSDRYAEL